MPGGSVGDGLDGFGSDNGIDGGSINGGQTGSTSGGLSGTTSGAQSGSNNGGQSGSINGGQSGSTNGGSGSTIGQGIIPGGAGSDFDGSSGKMKFSEFKLFDLNFGLARF